MVEFVSKNKNTSEFIQMGRLLYFLEMADNKGDKVDEIKAARANGLITEEEAIELAVEFC